MEAIQRQKLKVEIVDQKIDQKVARASYESFKGNCEPMNALYERYGYEVVSIATNLNYARYKRKQRVQNRVEDYVLQGECYFLTMTFSDSVLANTSPKTRRAYVRRYLKSFSSCYVANIDYGKTTHREHYHALIVAPEISKNPWHKYGFMDIRKVGSSKGNLEATCKYVVKITNHAMKVNDGILPRIIYSRPCSALK